jgi:hypothetical protein
MIVDSSATKGLPVINADLTSSYMTMYSSMLIVSCLCLFEINCKSSKVFKENPKKGRSYHPFGVKTLTIIARYNHVSPSGFIELLIPVITVELNRKFTNREAVK